MVIGLLRVELRIGESQSLKDKRRALQGVKDRLRQAFNVSVAETAEQDTWQRAELGIACVGTDAAGVNGLLSRVVQALERERVVELSHYDLEIL